MTSDAGFGKGTTKEEGTVPGELLRSYHGLGHVGRKKKKKLKA